MIYQRRRLAALTAVCLLAVIVTHRAAVLLHEGRGDYVVLALLSLVCGVLAVLTARSDRHE